MIKRMKEKTCRGNGVLRDPSKTYKEWGRNFIK